MLSSNPADGARTAELLSAYELMLEIRRTEETIAELRAAGDVVGSVHLSIGQEAVAVGVARRRAPGDVVFGTYRGHGWAIACGAPAQGVIAELCARAGGVSGGRGGSAHLSAPEWGFMGENAIIGAQLPMAVGAALAARHDGSGRVAIGVLGDGAANQGAVYEAFNMAGAWKLPVVFVLENNRYAELTPIAATVADPDLSRRGEPFGIPGVRVDGNDVLAVADVAGEAIERARAGDGPTLVEADTYRLVGHYIGDAEAYRTAEEVEEARGREPLVVARRALSALGVGGDELERVERRVADRVAAATAAALADDPADPELVGAHLYA